MNELPYIQSPAEFQQELQKLADFRKISKIKTKRSYRLTTEERRVIYEKTGGRCHVCGGNILVDKFEADHVRSHSSGGINVTGNFLPACRTCNNYRWDYISQEFQWILKLGVWARTLIEKNDKMGVLMSDQFVKFERKREARRKQPRFKNLQ